MAVEMRLSIASTASASTGRSPRMHAGALTTGAGTWALSPRDLGAFSSNSPEPAGILIMPQDNLYGELCFYENLLEAFRKAAKGKSGKWYVIEFRKDLKNLLLRLKRN